MQRDRSPSGKPARRSHRPKAGNSACFTRVYDADHLHNNPKQTTTAMVVWLTYDKAYGDPAVLALGLGIGISRKGDSLPLFAQGGCAWDERANRDTSTGG
jgi:hypothetical protein